jgi:hypothetical protein
MTVTNGARRFVFRMGTLHLLDVQRLINSGDFRHAIERLSQRLPEIARGLA